MAERANIEAERRRLQMTKEQMSKAIGITPKTYNRYIEGEAIPSAVLIRLYDLTGRTVDDLLGLNEMRCMQ